MGPVGRGGWAALRLGPLDAAVDLIVVVVRHAIVGKFADPGLRGVGAARDAKSGGGVDSRAISASPVREGKAPAGTGSRAGHGGGQPGEIAVRAVVLGLNGEIARLLAGLGVHIVDLEVYEQRRK